MLKRKTYSIDHQCSMQLAQHALNFTNKLGRSVSKQSILDALIISLKEKNIHDKVLSIVKTSHE